MDKHAVDELTVNGIMHIASSSLTYTGISQTNVIYFNKNLMNNYKLDMPYQLVRDGKWTIDKLMEITKDVYEDTNGNSEQDSEDIYGFVSFSQYVGFNVSAKVPVIAKDDKEILKLNVLSEDMTNLVNTMYKLFFEQKGTRVSIDEGGNKFEGKAFSAYPCDMFAAGKAMFATGTLSYSETAFRTGDIDYGILPVPKYSESQQDYNCLVTDNGIVVPATVTDTERTGIIFEALNAEGYKQIIPAYYETAFKDKFLSDDNDVEMLELINESKNEYFSYVYMRFHIMGVVTSRLMNTKSTDLASYYAANKSASEEALKSLPIT